MSHNRTREPSSSRGQLLPRHSGRVSWRLGLAPPGVINPPTSVGEGVARHWAATLREAIQRTEGRDIDLGWVASTVVPHGLHPDYYLDF